MAAIAHNIQLSAGERSLNRRAHAKAMWDEREKLSRSEAEKFSISMEYPLSSNSGLKECFTVHKGRKDGAAKKLSTWLVASACDSIAMQIVGMLLHGKKMQAAEELRGSNRLSVELAKEAKAIYQELCDMHSDHFEEEWFQEKAIEDVIKLCWGINATTSTKINEGQLYCAISGYQICSGGLTSYTQSTRRYLTATLLEKVADVKPAKREHSSEEEPAAVEAEKSTLDAEKKKLPSRSAILACMTKEDMNIMASILKDFVAKIDAEEDDNYFDPRDVSSKNAQLQTLISKFWAADSVEVQTKAYNFSISLFFPRASFGQETWLAYLEVLASTLPKKALQHKKEYINFFADNEQLLSDLMVYAFVSYVCGCNYRVWNIFSTRRENLPRVNEMCGSMEYLIVNDMEKADAFGTDSPFTKKLANYLAYGEAFSEAENDDEENETCGVANKRTLKRSSRTELLLQRARKRHRLDVENEVADASQRVPSVAANGMHPPADVEGIAPSPAVEVPNSAHTVAHDPNNAPPGVVNPVLSG